MFAIDSVDNTFHIFEGAINDTDAFTQFVFNFRFCFSSGFADCSFPEDIICFCLGKGDGTFLGSTDETDDALCTANEIPDIFIKRTVFSVEIHSDENITGIELPDEPLPDSSKKQAVEKLWQAILSCSRADGDAILNWEQHNKTIAEKCKICFFSGKRT